MGASTINARIGLVVPCYNEALRLDLNYWTDLLASLPEVFFLFVNDGSMDNTALMISSLTEPNFGLMTLEKNSGKAEAVRKGLLSLLDGRSQYDILGFVDWEEEIILK
jgi:glycosyltransferase involved in cell wall biosynthesis